MKWIINKRCRHPESKMGTLWDKLQDKIWNRLIYDDSKDVPHKLLEIQGETSGDKADKKIMNIIKDW